MLCLQWQIQFWLCKIINSDCQQFYYIASRMGYFFLKWLFSLKCTHFLLKGKTHLGHKMFLCVHLLEPCLYKSWTNCSCYYYKWSICSLSYESKIKGIMCYLFPSIRRFVRLNFTNPFSSIFQFAWLNFTNPFPSIRWLAWLNFTNILHNFRINDSMVYFDFEQFSLLPLQSYRNFAIKTILFTCLMINQVCFDKTLYNIYKPLKVIKVQCLSICEDCQFCCCQVIRWILDK